MDPNQGKKNLINKQGRQELVKYLNAEKFKRITVSLYRYFNIKEPESLRDELYEKFKELKVLGRIYLAKEGINAQINVPEFNWKKFKKLISLYELTKEIPLKIAIEDDDKSFIKLKIKVKNKIVADGLDQNSFDTTNVGTHLTAKQWNEFIEQNKSVVVDVRNHYESEIGHFKSAILPESETFKEELPKILDLLTGKEDKKIMLYCTGGIRCEKASAYLKHHGFKDVNQLYGGIIDYARQVKKEKLANYFKGKNFVFDERLAERISDEIISECHQCGSPSDIHVNCLNKECNLLFIQCKKCNKVMQNCCSKKCKEIISLPDSIQKEMRKGKHNFGNAKRFNKRKNKLKI